jgi:hypothetical protein
MLKSVVALAALSLCSVAHAGTVLFSEDFDSITSNTLNITGSVASMDVFGGVDAVVPTNPFGITGLTSTVIDLDGTPGPGGVGKGGFNLVAGRTYTLDFLVGGAQRRSAEDALIVALLSDVSGDLKLLGGTGVFDGIDSDLLLSADFAAFAFLAGNTPFTNSSLSLRAVSNTGFAFRIATDSSDNIGPLLDSVSLTETMGVIPEPATWAMLIMGFGVVGIAARRRRTSVTA